MKPIPAIVEPAEVDVDLIAEQIIVARAEQRDAENSAERHEQLGAAARATAKMRRIEIGRLLARARIAWPRSGPKAKGWSEFLARVKMDDSTAVRYINEFNDPEGSAQPRAKSPSDDERKPVAEADLVAGLAALDPAARKRVLRDLKPANVNGGSGAPERGAYCTPEKYAIAVGSWDLDPFSNPRSRIVARESCQLERGDNGLLDPAEPGSYLIACASTEPFDIESDDAIIAAATRGRHVASATTRVYIQPDYRMVKPATAHYGHTRFCALLRFAPDTRWFGAMWPRVAAIAIPRERLPFETPEGIELEGADEGEDRGAPFPHVFYYADERDITPAIRELCIVLRVEH